MSVHVIPCNDERKHVEDAACWCEPRVEWIDPETGLVWEMGEPMVIHNAADCRELGELDGESVEPGKDWEVLRDIPLR